MTELRGRTPKREVVFEEEGSGRPGMDLCSPTVYIEYIHVCYFM